MEQNLSERERKIRLGLGVVSGAGAVASHLYMNNIYLTIGLAGAATGFIANYFTCFCGTKKAFNSLKEKF